MEKNSEFLVSIGFNTNLFGLRRRDVKTLVDNGDDIILDLSPGPAAVIREHFPAARKIFLMPDEVQILIERLRERNCTRNEAFARLQMAKEMTYASEYDCTVINHNNRLQETINQLCQIISQEKLTKSLRAKLVGDISFYLFKIRINTILASLYRCLPQLYEKRYTSHIQQLLFFSDELAESPKIAAAFDRYKHEGIRAGKP